MLFTEGKQRETERLMPEKPGFGRDKVVFATAENKDCPHCLHYERKKRRCAYEKCVVFKE